MVRQPVTSHCVIHERIEPLTNEPYQFCLECGHVYVTKQELVDAHNKAIEGYNKLPGPPIPLRTVDKPILFCGYCLHDFVFPPNPNAYTPGLLMSRRTTKPTVVQWRRIACPLCYAIPGELCRVLDDYQGQPTGSHKTQPHTARVKVACTK